VISWCRVNAYSMLQLCFHITSDIKALRLVRETFCFALRTTDVWSKWHTYEAYMP
jgi:hypothetical protein